jgi:hypothetical protein
MRRVSIEGVLVGGIVDLVISFFLRFSISTYEFAKISQMAKDRVASTFPEILSLHAGHLAIGLCCSILGGYVAARIAGHDELLNGAASAFLRVMFGLPPVVLGLFARGFGMDLNLQWTHLLLLVAAPLLGLLGGYLRLRQTRRLQPA